MADRSSERDRRVRQLIGNKNPGFDVLGQAQAEIQDAQSELYNHVALQQAADQSRLQETSTISQAAQGMMEMEKGDQLQVQAASMNPSTQATLGRFGVKPSQSQSSSRNAQSQRVVTKSGDTTNIKNENVTNNRTDIKITQPSIPMQAPVIPMKSGGGGKDDSGAKFKTWLSGMFARQQNEAEIQRKEYRKKEWALGRTTSKLMKKIGEATSNLGTRLDPKNMNSTLGGQLKWLLLIFGATMIGKVWKPAMKLLANLEGGIRAAFGLPINEELRGNATEGLSIVDKIKEAIGIDKGDNTTLIQGVGKVFMQGIDKLIDKLKFWFEDRAGAMKEIEFPSVGKVDFGALGGVLGPAMDGVVNTLKSVGQYLGDLITVAFGGSKGKVKVEANKVQRKAQQIFTNTKGKQTSLGDSGLATGKGRNYMKESDYDTFGNLKGNAASTQAMSQSLISMFNDKSGRGHTAEIATGVSQLFGTAKRQGYAVIDPELLKYLGLGQQDLVTLQKNGMLVQKPYRIIAVRPNEAQKEEMGVYNGSKGFWGGLGLGTIGGALGGAAFGAVKGAALGSAIPGFGTVAGGVIGGVTGLFLGGAGGGLVGAGAGAAGDAITKQLTSWYHSGLYPKLVPADSNEVSADGSRGIGRMMWALDSRGVDAVKGKITQGMTNKDTDLTNKEFYQFIRKRGEAVARRNGVSLGRETMDTNNLNVAQARYDAYNKEWYDRYESKDKNSYNQQNFKNWDAFSDTVSDIFDSGVSMISSGLKSAGLYVKGMKVGRPQQNQRAAYLMKLAMKYGFTKEQAAGIAGNAMRESGMITETAYTANDSGAGPGGGLVGWLGDNCRQVLRYARDLYECDVNPNNVEDIKKVPFETQADILLRQLTGDLEYSEPGRGKRAGNAIRNARTVAEATRAMERKFEVSGDYRRDPYLTKRTEFANGFYQMDITAVDLSQNALGSPITVSNDGMMVGKSGSASQGIRNWLWGGEFPKYYDPKDEAWARSLQVRLRVPIHNTRGEETTMVLTINKKLSENVSSIFQSIFKDVPQFKINPDYTAGFNFRKVNSGRRTPSNKLSNHSSGGAIDINWNVNTLKDPKSEDTVTHLGTTSHPVVQIFLKHGWIWGGVWSNKDKMHFEYGGGTTEGNFGGNLGPINDFIDGVGDALISAGDALDPNKPEDSDLLTSIPLTEEQKIAQKNLDTYTQLTNQVNIGSLLSAGAKVDNYGVYVEGAGGTNLYLKDNATGLGGKLTKDDVAFVGRINKETGKLDEVSADEEYMAKNSISVEAASLFSSYKGKGSSSDRMTGKGGVIKFYLGKKFKDIDGYSDYAKKALGGSIEFYICPSKDASRVSYIEIKPVFSSGLGVTIDNTESREWGMVGPCIYDRGRKWYNPWGDDMITSDWSPTSTMHRVRLTPEAEREKQNLFRILSFGKIFEKDGKLYKSSDGTELNEADYEDAKRYRILTGQQYKIGSRHNTELFSNYGMSDDVSSALGVAKQVTLEGGKFKTADYFEYFGLSFKDREKFFKENKDSFVFKPNGDISGPGGVIWGKGTKDNFKLFGTEEEFQKANEALGAEGMKKYNQENLTHFENVSIASKGLVNMNAVGDFIHQVSSNIDIHGKDKDIADRIEKRRDSKTRTSKTYGYGMIGGKKYRYWIYSNLDGTTRFFKVSKNDLINFVKDYSGLEVFNSEQIQPIQATNLDDLQSKLIDSASSLIIKASNSYDARKAREKAASSGDFSDFNDLVKSKKLELKRKSDRERSDSSKSRRGTYDLLKRHLLDLERLVAGIEITNSLENPRQDDVVAIVSFIDGGVDKLTLRRGFYFNKNRDTINKSWIDGINEEIQKNIKDKTVEAGAKYFEGSAYQDSLNTLLDKVKSGEIEGIVTDDGKVKVKSTGTIVGTYDPKGQKPSKDNGFKGARGLTNADIQNDEETKDQVIRKPLEFFNDENNKIRYYQREFGAVADKDGLWVYDKTGKFRTKINLAVSLGSVKHKKDVLDRNSTQGFDMVTKKWVNIKDIGTYAKYNEATGDFADTGLIDSTWSNGAEELRDKVLNNIANGIEGINQGIDLGNAYNKITSSNSDVQVTAERLAARQRNKQVLEQAKLVAKNQKQVDLLEIIADKSLTPNEITVKIDQANTAYNNAIQKATLDVLRSDGVVNIKGSEALVYTTQYGDRQMLVTKGSKGRLWTYEVDPVTGDAKQTPIEGVKSYSEKGDQLIVNYVDGKSETWNITSSERIRKTITTDGTEK